MKNLFKMLVFAFAFLLMEVKVSCQDKAYSTSGFEMIFSWADLDRNHVSQTKDVRFSWMFNFGEYWHYDITNNVGLFSGLFVRNIGFITNDEAGFDKIKRRSYTLGMPLAVKFGHLNDDYYLFAGAEYEMLFHYKEKRWLDGEKQDKITEWFSERTNRFVPSLFVGMQFPKGVNIKMKYYLDDFLNKDYVSPSGEDYSIYTKSVPFYLSVSFYLKNRKMFDFLF